MLRVLLISFFCITSTKLYLDSRKQTDPQHQQTQLVALTTNESIVLVQPPVKIRTVAKVFEQQQIDNRRFQSKEQIRARLISNNKYNPLKAPAPRKEKLKALKPNDKYRIALLIKAELKRIGCYKGTISGSWDNAVLKGLSHFNLETAQNLESKRPQITTLSALKMYTKRSCRSRFRLVKKPVTNRPRITLALLPQIKPVEVAKISASSAHTANALPFIAAVQPKTTKRSRTRIKKKVQHKVIARVFEDDDDAYYTPPQKRRRYKKSYKVYKKRPPASTVGRRKARPARRAITKRTYNVRKQRSYKRKAKRKKTRKRHARAKKRRSIRRRYRRARKRFGFSHEGGLGYW